MEKTKIHHSSNSNNESSLFPYVLLNFFEENSIAIDNLEVWYSQQKNNLYAMWPEIKQISAIVEKQVKQNGYTVVSCLGLKNFTRKTKELALFTFLSSLGELTIHSTKDFFWDIKHRQNMKKEDNTTFSEQYGECPLHSDSAFSEFPERYLTMYVIQPASDGGDSVFVSMEKLASEIKKTPDGVKCLSILSNECFPFETPSSFNKSTPIFLSPILGEGNKIRFRYDCIIKGFEKRPDLQTSEKMWAVDFFNNYLQYKATRNVFSADEDQLIIIDNHYGLHARTDFLDEKRHLLRARIA
ncbi:TauD/TfdA family dioxygenase [Xenorhabdus sp. DI]|uniref:TauD/TfdA family dioxygenase n=1 Tax=Xenorhabdus doucetiae TaxID=351671 RepID=UPI0019B9D397|nr:MULTISPECIES: TauD/TfdA family dioxygenase [unclassified Xenorhabdus]MBD2783465.1 TauD/TfdA family dioxygenase [Xenorhabdus sp. 3]MBD2787729.1 TauD/TfdA family dioxygenase [Xenorhabdus sp. DI]